MQTQSEVHTLNHKRERIANTLRLVLHVLEAKA